MKFLKKYLVLIILFIALVFLDIFQKELFFTIFILYGLFIKFLLSETINEKLRKVLKIIIWTIFLATTFLLFYSNYHFPRGQMIYTGDIVCMNDGRGPCRESFIEDTWSLNIPDWAKFFKRSGGSLLWLGMLFAGIVVTKNKGDEVSD